jgi:hypothetical protein
MLTLGRVDMKLIGRPGGTGRHGVLMNPFDLFLEDKIAKVTNKDSLIQRRRSSVIIGIDVRFYAVGEGSPTFTMSLQRFGVSSADEASEHE